MVSTFPRQTGSSSNFRDLLEANYQNKSVVHLASGSAVPLLKDSIWVVVRGLVKLGAVTEHGDELLLGLAGPNQPFGASLSDVEAYEAVTSTDCDLLCLSLEEIEQSTALSMAMVNAIGARYRQSEQMLLCWVCVVWRTGCAVSWRCWCRTTDCLAIRVFASTCVSPIRRSPVP